ncbi:hypothetical protein HYX18_02900 [Candidatus Woesearchaeota archaeon]|nr:hypothetical protein [Candidatus Woesearchaeota archaeon]
MALFRKKKSNEKESLKDFPDFPSTFAPDLRFPEFPAYQEDDNPFKEPSAMSSEEFKSSEKENSYESLLDRPLAQSRSEDISPRQMGFQQRISPMPPMPDMMESRPFSGMQSQDDRHIFHEDKPLFVKIDDYEEAIYTLDKIKSKLKEADRILDELNKIRAEEERQLEEWKRDLASVKEKLLIIDKQLFENT